MQKLFVSVFNGIYRVSRHMDKRLRTLILFFCCLIIMNTYLFSKINFRPFRREALSGIVALIMIFCSIEGPQKPVRWNRAVIYPSILFGAGILIISLIHPVGAGFVMYAVDLIIIFPALYFVWANRGDHEVLYDLLSVSILIEGLISFVYTFVIALNGQLQVPGGRVTWFGYNPNYMGMWGVLMLLAGLYLMRRYREKMMVVIPAAACAGAGIAYCILPVSRTAMLAEMMTALLYILFCVKAKRAGREELKGNRKKIIIAALIICGVMIAGLQMDDVNGQALARAGADGSAQETAQEASDITDRLSADEGLNSFSSGRIGIWKIYIRNFSLFGKELDSILDELRNEPSINAHNNIIEFYFRFGYIVGSVFLIYYIAQGLRGLKLLFSKGKASPQAFFVVAATGLYSLYALLEIAILPFVRCITCVYFLSISPLMTETEKEERSVMVLDGPEI